MQRHTHTHTHTTHTHTHAGKVGKDALARSAQLMEGMKSTYGWPFVALILAVGAYKCRCRVIIRMV